ncbi:MAG: hypothetical protein J0I12_26440 [Candidatus Eremiobacteraeota bacterium]|nr:hypothetical protein [Candidatus Eremiobacteraeota bacterium]
MLCWAQPRATDPQSYAVIYQLASVRPDRFVELEMQRASLESLALPTGLEQVFVRIPGAVSSVEVPNDGRPLSFVVRNRWPQTWSWSQLDPTGFRLALLKTESSNRILHLRESNGQRTVVHRGLPLKVTPRNADSLLLETVQPLESGAQYAIYYAQGEEPCDLFCFSVASSSP